MFDYLQRLLSAHGLAPHGYCLLWDPELIWTHVISDAVIGVSYFSIPVVLATFLTKRRDVQFGWIVWMFAAFIMACGATHFFSIWVLWHPDYGPEGLLKLATAAVSVTTAVALWPLLPRVIALPSPAQLQRLNEELSSRIHERDLAHAALERETIERRKTEEMLRQAQKMEAVGQLTGGIAHDFNNLLTVVIANLDRAHRFSEGDPRVAKLLGNALTGAERAAKLTDQLLAFSRKQPLQPSAQHLNDIVVGLRDLLERTLGNHINLALDLAPSLAQVAIDKNQTENAILNLAINARDAMPDGGHLIIRTREEDQPDSPSRLRILLEVIDDGHGMPPEVQERAFDPFFTTKAVGEGTGLGLSQVYGFTKQSSGDITIRSAMGSGTTVGLLLPVAA